MFKYSKKLRDLHQMSQYACIKKLGNIKINQKKKKDGTFNNFTKNHSPRNGWKGSNLVTLVTTFQTNITLSCADHRNIPSCGLV